MVDAVKPVGTDPAKPAGVGMAKGKDAFDELTPKKLVPKPQPVAGRSIGIGIMVAATLISMAWIVQSRFATRYQLVPVHQQENTFMYRLDTFSGAVHFCTSQQCVDLPIR